MASWPEKLAPAAAALLWCLAGTAARGADPAFFDARVAPVLQQHCVTCHGEERQKGGLRLDRFDFIARGGEDGLVVAPGSPKDSELVRRITLPDDDDDVMPADGKPHLSPDEIKVFEMWIAAGASAARPLSAFPGAPNPDATFRNPPKPGEGGPPPRSPKPFAPDYRPRLAQITALETALGIRLVPRSEIATDGLILRTASAPERCDDAAVARLAPIADLIVDAELARTKITDASLKPLAACSNLRSLDLSRTAVTSAGLGGLKPLQKLESLNLTDTLVDGPGVADLRSSLPRLRHLWLFGTKADAAEAPEKSLPLQ